MKIRNGFVSNSSSSSFVILLPNNFDINAVDFGTLVEEYGEGEIDVDQARSATEQFLKNKEFWEQDGYPEMEIIRTIFKKYVIAEMDGGPDDGKIIIASTKKVKKILGIIDETTETV